MSLDLEAIQRRLDGVNDRTGRVGETAKTMMAFALWHDDVPALLAHCRAQAAEIERLQEEIERLQPFEALCGAYARDAKRQAEEAWPA